MISLYDYIQEAAIGNIGISFEEFKEIVNRGKGDRSIMKKFSDRFDSSWVDKYSVFLTYLDKMIVDMYNMKVELDDNILRFIYDRFCNTPSSVVDKMIGKGANASVYDMGDKVIKIFFEGKVRSDNRRFYEYCKKSSFKYFPKIYRLGKGYVIMEKLKVNTPKIKRMIDIIDAEVGEMTRYWQLKEGVLDWGSLTAEEAEVMHWLEDCGEELWKNHILPKGDYGDLQEDNLGERADGTVIYFDI